VKGGKMKKYKLLHKKNYPIYSTKNKKIFLKTDLISGTCNVAFFVNKNPLDWEKIKSDEKKKFDDNFINHCRKDIEFLKIILNLEQCEKLDCILEVLEDYQNG